MSGSDSEVFNLLERAESGDLNDAQSIQARFLSELARYSSQSREVGVPAGASRNAVFGGLDVSPSGADVAVFPGYLGQQSATLAPVPGPLDSSFRLAWLDSPITVTMPSPGVTTFYLVEAQMVETISLSQPRDIWTPPAGPFVPALVTKQIRRTVQTQLLTGAGGQAPAPSGGDWVPLAIVRRPGGGGPVVGTDVVDVRPMGEWGRQRPAYPSAQGTLVDCAGNTNLARIAAQVDGPFGVLSYQAPLGTLDPTAVDVLSPATVLAASTAYFLYLCPWSVAGLAPRQQNGAVSQQGVLVLSSVAPVNGSRQNSAAVTLPAPFGVTTVPAGDAYLVGALWRNSANTGWLTQASAAGAGSVRHEALLAAVLAPPVAAQNVNLAGFVPAHATTAKLILVMQGSAAVTTPCTVEIIDPTTSLVLSTLAGDFGSSSSVETEVPVNGLFGQTFDLNVVGAIPGTASISVQVAGYGV
jgi:hypothetical protein